MQRPCLLPSLYSITYVWVLQIFWPAKSPIGLRGTFSTSFIIESRDKKCVETYKYHVSSRLTMFPCNCKHPAYILYPCHKAAFYHWSCHCTRPNFLSTSDASFLDMGLINGYKFLTNFIFALFPLLTEPWDKETMNIQSVGHRVIIASFAFLHVLIKLSKWIQLSKHVMSKTGIIYLKKC